ncbi:MAG: restriction endonuclease subunit S [Gammaproteobacteria bacterium]|nr:restriction endonuclease subunit S [Gammaproteobacteria bacterium]
MKGSVRIREVATKIGSGQTPRGGHRSYGSKGIPLIRSQNVLMGAFSAEGLAFISCEIDEAMEGSRVQQGDVLLNITGASIGRVCVVPTEICPANVNQHVCIIRCNESIDPEYLSAFMAAPNFQRNISDAQAGGTRQALTKQTIEEFEIPLIPIDEQRLIASQLKRQQLELSRARQVMTNIGRKVELLRASIYRESFCSIVPVATSKNLEEPSYGWHWHKLSNAARLESGHTPSRLRPDWWGGDISWLSLTEIRALDGQWVESTQLRTNEAGVANSAARILPRGTVCFSRTASVGFVAIMAKPMATSQDFANWVCSDDLDPEFLMYALIRSRNELRGLATGATHKTIYMPTLESFHICAPDLGTQRRIVRTLRERLAAVESLHAGLEQQAKDLAALPQRLLARAFGGAA